MSWYRPARAAHHTEREQVRPAAGAAAHRVRAPCNTTFSQLAADLPPNALANAADQFGLNADFDIPGFPTEAGKVEATESPAEQVEAGIGQSRCWPARSAPR